MVDESRLVDTFCDLVRIDSLSFHESAVAGYVVSALADIGVTCSQDDAGGSIGGDCGNIIAHLPGEPDRQPMLFNAHLDTVEPGLGVKPKIDGGVIVSDGSTILGADDKAGVAVIIEAVRCVAESGVAHAPLDIVFTVAEEKGLLGAKALDTHRLSARIAFVFDSAGPVGHVTVRAPFQDSIEAVFHGRATHAGVEPEKGANAIVAAAKAIAAMKLGRISPQTTANIGVIEGGRASNIIADRVLIKGEARSLFAGALESQSSGMIDTINAEAEAAGCAVTVEKRREYDGFSLTAADAAVRIVQAAAKEVGVEAVLEATGGGADTNVFNSLGLTAVGLGVGYRNPHSEDERLPVSDLVTAAKLAVAIACTSIEPGK